MAAPTSFLSLPREIRDIIYDYALEDVQFTNTLTAVTAYTPQTFPLLFVDKGISDDLQPRLYENHTMVIPIQEPCQYIIKNSTFAPQVAKCSRMMKERSKTIVIEMAQTDMSHHANAELDEDGNPEIAYEFWESQGSVFAEKLIDDLLALKPELPGFKTVKLVFWFANWIAYSNEWSDALERLTKEWPEIFLEIELNLFEYVDQDAGDGGSNWVEGWNEWADREEVTFQAMNFEWNSRSDGSFDGRMIDVAAWQDEDFIYMNMRERDMDLHWGSFKVSPMFLTIKRL
ncbi:hypothetical protein DER45DRAFT_158118 [Fusarium avenaceum]|nr:hypothetical protein DER45DRAFT_158118 [Fusarium avenaceum]